MRDWKWFLFGGFLLLLFLFLFVSVGQTRNKPKVFKTKIKKELVNLKSTKCSEIDKFEEAVRKGDEYDAEMQALVDSLNAVIWEEIGGIVKKYRKNYSLLYLCNSGEICSIAYYHAISLDSLSSIRDSIFVVKDFFLYVYEPLRRIEIYCGKTLFKNIPVWDKKLTKEYLYKE